MCAGVREEGPSERDAGEFELPRGRRVHISPRLPRPIRLNPVARIPVSEISLPRHGLGGANRRYPTDIHLERFRLEINRAKSHGAIKPTVNRFVGHSVNQTVPSIIANGPRLAHSFVGQSSGDEKVRPITHARNTAERERDESRGNERKKCQGEHNFEETLTGEW